MPASQELVRVGRIVKPHGIRGEIIAEPEGETLGRLASPATVYVGDPPAERILESVRAHAGRLLVSVAGVTDRTAAEGLRGAWIRVPAAALPPAQAGCAYVDDLVGCRLEDEDGRPVGTVRGVLGGGGQDLLQVDTEAGEVLVPMVGEWLLELDPAGGRIRMRLPAGLVAD